MALIKKARSLRQDDEDLFDDFCDQLSPDLRDHFRSKISDKFNPINKKATTAILKKMWEGNHLLEYFKFIVNEVSEDKLLGILKEYEFLRKQAYFAKFEDFKNQFASGIGRNRSNKLFFVLATAQQISVLKCLLHFLEFCLNENRPLQYFYSDDKSFDQYVENASNLLKERKNKKIDLALTLHEDDRLKLEEYIEDIKKYLEINPYKSELKADFEDRFNSDILKISLGNTSVSDPFSQSSQPRLTIPQPRENNVNYYANTILNVIGRAKQKARLKEFLTCDKNIAWFQLAGDAGQGKSRLAFDLIFDLTEGKLKELGWCAGFVTDSDINNFKNCWKIWQPNKPHLLVFDYVIGREKKIKSVLKALIYRKEEFQHKIRILLVEKQRWDHRIILKIQNEINNNILSQLITISDKAQWFLDIKEADDSEAARLISYCFDDGVEILKQLDKYNLIKIIEGLFYFFSRKKLTIPKPELIQALERIDDSGRPLYAYLLAQQLVESDKGFKNWTKIDLLQFQLNRDKLRWERAFKKNDIPTWGDEHLAMKLAVLATIVDELKFDDPKIRSYFGTIGSRVRKEAVSITSGYILNKNDRPQEIFALKPPLLGGWFVLICFHQGLKFEGLLNIAWQYSPDKTATFLHRITQDFLAILPVTLLPKR